MTSVKDIGPLDWRISIVDKSGRPSPEFQRRWNANRNNTALIGTISFGSGPPSGSPQDGAEYVDITTTPYTLYVGNSTAWHATGSTGANPSVTAGPTAINGTATTYMRSDAAPAIQLATTGLFGLVKPDGSTINISSGVISVPVATSSVVGLVRPDGVTITISGGVLSAGASSGGYMLPLANGDTPGVSLIGDPKGQPIGVPL